jgi:hypothetical protein
VAEILTNSKVKQFLRLAIKTDLESPYIAISLPNEKLVANSGEIESTCVILLKAGQKFTRNQSKLQEIALDSL